MTVVGDILVFVRVGRKMEEGGKMEEREIIEGWAAREERIP